MGQLEKTIRYLDKEIQFSVCAELNTIDILPRYTHVVIHHGAYSNHVFTAKS
jgi:hypothetical protein